MTTWPKSWNIWTKRGATRPEKSGPAKKIAVSVIFLLHRKVGFPIFRFPGHPQRCLDEIKLGAIAQLGERLNGIQEVVGSIPSGSTKKTLRAT